MTTLKSKKATTATSGRMAKTLPTPSLIGALHAGAGVSALTEGKTRSSNVKGSAAVKNEPKLTANPDALLLSILRSSQQTNQVLQQVAASLHDQRASVVVHHGSSDGSHLDGEYVVGQKRFIGQLGDNSQPTMDRDVLKRVRGEGSVNAAMDNEKLSPQRQSIRHVEEELAALRLVYGMLRAKLSNVLPEGLNNTAPRACVPSSGEECVDAADSIFSPAEFELFALRRNAKELRTDLEYIVDHLRT